MAKKAHGVPKRVAEQVIERDKGMCTIQVLHKGMARPGEQISHRSPRGMGGTRDTELNLAGNLMYACAACHEFIEKNRTLAYDNGWLIRGRQRPSTTPVLYRGEWKYLTWDGKVVDFLSTPWEGPGGAGR